MLMQHFIEKYPDIKSKFEIRPESLSSRGIKLPMVIHKSTGNRTLWLDANFTPIDDQFGYVYKMQNMKIDPKIFVDFLSSHWAKIKAEKKRAALLEKEKLTAEIELIKTAKKIDFPACLKHYISTPLLPGIRNAISNSIIRYAKSYLKWTDTYIENFMEKWFSEYSGESDFSISQHMSEVRRILNTDKLNFKCDDHYSKDLLKPYCNIETCPILKKDRQYFPVQNKLFHSPDFIKLSPSSRIIYLELLSRKAHVRFPIIYNNEPAVYATIDNLVESTGIAESTVKRCMKQLSQFVSKVPFNIISQHRSILLFNDHLNMRIVPNYYILNNMAPSRRNTSSISSDKHPCNHLNNNEDCLHIISSIYNANCFNDLYMWNMPTALYNIFGLDGCKVNTTYLWVHFDPLIFYPILSENIFPGYLSMETEYCYMNHSKRTEIN